MKVISLHEIDYALSILESLNCPRALTVAIMLREGHFDDIVSLRADPEAYDGHSSFFRAYQATRLLQKSKWLPTTFDKKEVAISSFWTAESKCKETNEIFRRIEDGTLSPRDPRVWKQLLVAKRKISSILSGASPFSFLDHCGFGPGSDMSTRGGFTSAYNKLSSSGSVTRECSVFLDFLAQNSSLGRLFQWDIKSHGVIAERVRGNRVAFVPKDCKTDRSIAVEPRWNVFFQKGMGKVLRRLLKGEGCDLDDQSRNQSLAREGSQYGSYATIDLQSASDTVSSELVRFLLPQEWVSVLDRLRSSWTRSPSGEWFLAEKWSSMGNGYTFELESLIFFALSWAVCGKDSVISVYGDDIIIPSYHYNEIVELLAFCGFSVNGKKSFSTGPFRESCGGDFYNGFAVTPIYWKEPLNVEGTLRLVNQISVLARRLCDGHSRDRSLRRVWHSLVNRLPSDWSRRGPSSIGTCVHDSSGAWTKGSKWGWDGWHIRVMLPKPLRFRYKNFDAAVLSQFFSPSSDGYVIRDRLRYQLGTVFIPSGFEDIGPWI